ncbi:hypothetical protein MIR68_004522 [Amoeboaphelidium protococcarum]|nr:hypothetical protein MIR68_004522 [Amoeboaphelidium protococcarum]
MSSSAKVPALVSTQWCKSNLTKIIPVDATWRMPMVQAPSAFQDYLDCHLPNARFFDVEEVSDHNNPLPHMLPPADQFSEEMSQLGIGNDDHVVLYDNSGVFSSYRVYWTFKVFGHERVSILDGGILKWLKDGGQAESSVDEPQYTRTQYKATFNPQLVKDYSQIAAMIKDGREGKQKIQLLDARAQARFNGDVVEPRPGMKSGHIPLSKNLPYIELFNEQDRTLKSVEQLNEYWSKLQFDKRLPTTMTCGSGVTAAVLYVAAQLSGFENLSLYDGSWSEWGQKSDDIEK